MPWMPSMGTLAGSLPPDVHVVGFGKTVSVFSSKQKPKELTVYGSDFRYSWLAPAPIPRFLQGDCLLKRALIHYRMVWQRLDTMRPTLDDMTCASAALPAWCAFPKVSEAASAILQDVQVDSEGRRGREDGLAHGGDPGCLQRPSGQAPWRCFPQTEGASCVAWGLIETKSGLEREGWITAVQH